MSAFVLVLIAGMAGGNGPGAVSSEMVDGLDLSGRWEGIWLFRRREPTKVVLGAGVLDLRGDGTATAPCTFTDTGKGTVIMRLDGDVFQGIYRVDKGRVVLCFNVTTGERPSSFEAGARTMLFTLHRVKPGK